MTYQQRVRYTPRGLPRLPDWLEPRRLCHKWGFHPLVTLRVSCIAGPSMKLQCLVNHNDARWSKARCVCGCIPCCWFHNTYSANFSNMCRSMSPCGLGRKCSQTDSPWVCVSGRQEETQAWDVHCGGRRWFVRTSGFIKKAGCFTNEHMHVISLNIILWCSWP